MGLGTIGAALGAVIDGASGDDGIGDGALIGGVSGAALKVVLPVAVTFATGWVVLKGLGKLRETLAGTARG